MAKTKYRLIYTATIDIEVEGRKMPSRKKMFDHLLAHPNDIEWEWESTEEIDVMTGEPIEE